MNELTITALDEFGNDTTLLAESVGLKVNNYVEASLYHRRNIHRRLLGGFFVEASPSLWRGNFNLLCENVSFTQINYLKAALNVSLTSGPVVLAFDSFKIFGSYVPDTLKVTSSGPLAENCRQRDVTFSFDGKLTL